MLLAALKILREDSAKEINVETNRNIFANFRCELSQKSLAFP
jgi:hypothetical protein